MARRDCKNYQEAGKNVRSGFVFELGSDLETVINVRQRKLDVDLWHRYDVVEPVILLSDETGPKMRQDPFAPCIAAIGRYGVLTGSSMPRRASTSDRSNSTATTCVESTTNTEWRMRSSPVCCGMT